MTYSSVIAEDGKHVLQKVSNFQAQEATSASLPVVPEKNGGGVVVGADSGDAGAFVPTAGVGADTGASVADAGASVSPVAAVARYDVRGYGWS